LTGSGRVVIVGASLGGVRTARALQRGGFEGEIVLLGDEPHTPYDRPPLSKAFLTSDEEVSLELQRDDLYDGLDVRLGVRATGLDVASGTVTLDDGGEVAGDHVVIATGSSARQLPGTEDLDGVVTLRNLDDATRLRDGLRGAERLVIVGAGFIGCEVAASARSLGVDVVIVEPLDAPVVRGVGPVIGGVIADLHRGHGVTMHLGVGVDGMQAAGERTDVVLSDGRTESADLVLVGIGAVPNTYWVEGSGLMLDGPALLTDDRLRVEGGDGRIWAVGDVAKWPSATFGGNLRMEHWTNATEMASVVARNILDASAPAVHDPVPYVWSDQYDHKVQVLGVVSGDDEVEFVAGEPGEDPFLAAYFRDGRLRGVVGLDWPRAVMVARSLIVDGADRDAVTAYAETLTSV
jgi:NADPH-dependent 2,4-dienoyl-CoA reductase/sulfur reductase-like enzyme